MTTDLYEAQRPVIDALSSPATYPPDAGVDTVEIRETHSAVVFLAGAGAYKMKKAVNFGFLDFSTLRQRRFFCYQELFLNQRAAPTCTARCSASCRTAREAIASAMSSTSRPSNISSG